VDLRIFSLTTTIDHPAGSVGTPYLSEKVKKELQQLPEAEEHLENVQNQHRSFKILL
jgi:hypothetical protein